MRARRTVIITNLKNSPFRNIVIFLSVIMFVVVLLILIGVIGIFASLFFGSLGFLFLAKNKIKNLFGEAPRLDSRGIFTFFGEIRRSMSATKRWRIPFSHSSMSLQAWFSAKADKKPPAPLKTKSNSDFIELKKDDFKICE